MRRLTGNRRLVGYQSAMGNLSMGNFSTGNFSMGNLSVGWATPYQPNVL